MYLAHLKPGPADPPLLPKLLNNVRSKSHIVFFLTCCKKILRTSCKNTCEPFFLPTLAWKSTQALWLLLMSSLAGMRAFHSAMPRIRCTHFTPTQAGLSALGNRTGFYFLTCQLHLCPLQEISGLSLNVLMISSFSSTIFPFYSPGIEKVVRSNTKCG